MRKEVIFAIIVGLILGGIILYGVQLANTSSQKAASTQAIPSQETEPSAEVSPTSPKGLSVTSPLNHTVTNNSTVKITGTSLPGATVALHDSEDDDLVTTDASGNFTSSLTITGGENIITVSALNPNQKLETVQISVIYTTAKVN